MAGMETIEEKESGREVKDKSALGWLSVVAFCLVVVYLCICDKASERGGVNSINNYCLSLFECDDD